MDANGVLAAAFDPTTNALRVTPNATALAADPAFTDTFTRYGVMGGYIAGGYTGHPGARSTAIPAEATVQFQPVIIPKACSVNRIAAEVTIVGAVGAVVRLGIYDMGVDGLPGALILDAGTIDGTAVAVAEITINQALTPGIKFLASCVQGGALTRPTMTTITTGGILIPAHTSNTFAAPRVGWSQAGVTGAFASPAVANTTTTSQAIKSLRFV